MKKKTDAVTAILNWQEKPVLMKMSDKLKADS